MKLLFISTLSALALAFSCNKGQDKPQASRQDRLEESFIKANQHLLQVENTQIEAYIQRYDLKMCVSGTGLRYSIRDDCQGRHAEPGMAAVIEYTSSLLNGTPLYSSKTKGPLEFELGKGRVISGLEEGVLLLREGCEAKLIIPSHLAFGLLGDQDKVPAKATLVYDITLIKLKEKLK